MRRTPFFLMRAVCEALSGILFSPRSRVKARRASGEWVELLEPRLLLSDVTLAVVSKRVNYLQVGTTTPTLDIADGAYQISVVAHESAQGVVTLGTVTPPGASPQSMEETNDNPGLFELEFEDGPFDSQADLDAAYPDGTYHLALNTTDDGARNLTLSETGDNYPAAPYISSFGSLNGANPQNAIAVTWNPMSNGVTGDYIQFGISDINGDVIFETPLPGAVGALGASAVGTTIPAGTLQPQTQYQAWVKFIKFASHDTTDYPGVLAGGIYLANDTVNFTTGNGNYGTILVADQNQNGGTVGTYLDQGTTENAALLGGLNNPQGVAVSGSDVFVTNVNGGTVGEYTLQGEPVNPALISGLESPSGIAISGGNLFVADDEAGTIGEYSLSGDKVNASLITGIDGPEYLAISGSDLFVTSDDGNVGEYTLSGSSVNTQLISGLQSPLGIAITGSDLYVVSGGVSGQNVIGEYTTAGSPVSPSLITGLDASTGLAISGSDLLVGDTDAGAIAEYTLSGQLVNAQLVPQVADPAGIAVIGPGTRVSIAQVPTGVQAGLGVSNPLTVDVLDANGNLAIGDGETLTLSIAGGPPNGALLGDTSATIQSGAAVFNNFAFSGAGVYTLSISGPGLSGANSSPIAVATANAAGPIFVAESGPESISQYGASGTPVNTSFIGGVDNPAGMAIVGADVFVDAPDGSVAEYTTSGLPVNLSLIPGVSAGAIAASGSDLFVLNTATGTVGEYTLGGATVNAAARFGE